MHDRVTSGCGSPDRSGVEQVSTIGEVEANHRMAGSLEMLRGSEADHAAVSGDEDAHGDRIAVLVPPGD